METQGPIHLTGVGVIFGCHRKVVRFVSMNFTEHIMGIIKLQDEIKNSPPDPKNVEKLLALIEHAKYYYGKSIDNAMSVSRRILIARSIHNHERQPDK